MVVLSALELGHEVAGGHRVGHNRVPEPANLCFEGVAAIEEHDVIPPRGDQRVDVRRLQVRAATHDAVEIHVFPEAMRGTGEGSRAWDLGPNSTMTNATVDTTVSSNDGQVLMVKYRDGEKKVVIPPGLEIQQYVVGERSELKPGAAILIVLPRALLRRKPAATIVTYVLATLGVLTAGPVDLGLLGYATTLFVQRVSPTLSAELVAALGG